MQLDRSFDDLAHRDAPLEMAPEAFRAVGHRLVDRIADFLAALPGRRVTPAETADALRDRLGQRALPESGEPPEALLDEAVDLLVGHSLFNGHPRFWAYITSSAAPIGALADLLAASVNPNVGSWSLSPMATLIEEQAIRWIAELMGYPAGSDGLLVSGGNMANMVGFWAARTAVAGAETRHAGVGGGPRLVLYASVETHTWVQKAADLAGLGTDAIRFIPTDAGLRMEPAALEAAIAADRADGARPFLVVGTAGSVGTGAVDPLPALARICREQELWFHVDGAYGALAAAVPEAPADLRGLSEADSVAVDPHKWLYAPLEAGCLLCRRRGALENAFSYHPPYYHFDQEAVQAPPNYYERGPQNSRGFRALKVWLGLRQAGRSGYVGMIRDDMRLARALWQAVEAHPELEPVTCHLSITTFRYVPAGFDRAQADADERLNALNTRLLDRLQASGEAYLSNAVVGGRFLLRACFVNFRTRLADIATATDTIVRLGREVAREQS
jgi:aromatic-L-amino-acid decarboxylase